MGTKRALAPFVRNITDALPDGPLLDVFAGMGAIAEALSSKRPVWLNDIQNYAAAFARARFQTSGSQISVHDALDLLSSSYNANYSSLAQKFAVELRLEEEVIASGRAARVVSWRRRRNSIHNRPGGRAVLSRFRGSAPPVYQMFARSYSHGYFTLRQSMEVDSARAAIDAALQKRAICTKEKDWLLLALARAVRKSAFTTGHFAQYLTVSDRTLHRFQKVAARSVWNIFLEELGELRGLAIPSGSASNRVYRTDATTLLKRLQRSGMRPAIVYADPPYTADHYSRYYHIWESLVLYDYPSLSGKGRYRPDRFQTPYSIKAIVGDAFAEFIGAARALDATLVLSYPGNGLLHEAGRSPRTLLKAHYPKVEQFSIDHQHSTMGASDGKAKSVVTEHIYVGTL
jgi:adenine-specific DNA-methyltransferase